MLKEIANLEGGVVLLTGDAKKLAKIFLNVWLSKGKVFLVEYLPFDVEYLENVFIGNIDEGVGFDGYLLYSLLSRPKSERTRYYSFIAEHRDKLILIYEPKYFRDSVFRYALKNFIDYLVAYKRETMGMERIDVYKLEEGRVIKKKTYIRRF
ncbi:MAG TPA: hypothetical protein ENF72_04240 [Thermococcus litoralis]|uniref:KaiC-like domain-containing protein n=1 Tax=Thermococcus litoralis TaxID=2265 RepID=A0A7C0TZN3_THELI|nr:MAG: hypothetical protein DRN32_02155 [Thermococci archaeon]HDD31808.1 hypothetical protein [Thermococcus litoralis]